MNTRYLALFLISAATLVFQVVLTRFFSLAQGNHLAFMAVSLALLGIGASGTYLYLRRPKPADLPRLMSTGSGLFALAVLAAYLGVNYLPFDAYRLAWERVQWLWLVLYYLALTVPFFFSGLVIGAALAVAPEGAGPTYAANLLGSGLGPPLALLALATLGGSSTVFFCALLGWLAAGSVCQTEGGERLRVMGRNLKKGLNLAVAAILLYLMFRPPLLFDVRLTPYKALSQALLYPGSKVVYSEWNAFSRVDVIQSPGVRSAPGLSFAYKGDIPAQLGLVVDGDNLTPITNPDGTEMTGYLPPALAFELRPGADVLILEPGGGLAVLTALQNGAGAVTVVHSNPNVAEAVGRRFMEFNEGLYADPRVTVVVDDARSFLRRTRQHFDLIVLPLTDSFHPVTAGAYTLNEDYRYTVEAFTDALDRLAPNGLLAVERWLQSPPTESLRLWGTVVAALRHASETDPANSLIALRSLQTSLILAARSPLEARDIDIARTFAEERQFDLVWLPGIQPSEVNRYSVLPEPVYYTDLSELLSMPDPTAFYAGYAYAVAPPTDDHPFFFHFFKWSQTPEIIQTLGKTFQPFGGTGYLVLVVLLGLVLILSTVLILLPLAWSKAKNRPVTDETTWTERSSGPAPWLYRFAATRFAYLLYFALLGLGFLFVEIPLLQRFILYLGQPAYSFAVVVSALLVASGVGSGYLSGRLSLRLALPMIMVLTVIYPLLLPYLFEATLRLPFAGRIVVTAAVLFPLGALLGIPFPRGLALVGQTWPELVPWGWAVNGCASVISAVLAAMIALTWGFSAVVWSAALAYGLAWLVIGPGIGLRSSVSYSSRVKGTNLTPPQL